MILIWPSFIKYFTTRGTIALTLWPFIFLGDKSSGQDLVLLNHERIHLRQQLELLLIFFYLIYLGSYLINRWNGMKANEAYLNICFEREAYLNEKNTDYLKMRKWYSSFHF
jgi:hypothetical protein